MNVAFRDTDERGFWWEDAQAAALQSGDISGYGAKVDVDDLRDGATRRAATPRGAVLQRVYVSEYPVPPGEGIGEVLGRGSAPSASAARRSTSSGSTRRTASTTSRPSRDPTACNS